MKYLQREGCCGGLCQRPYIQINYIYLPLCTNVVTPSKYAARLIRQDLPVRHLKKYKIGWSLRCSILFMKNKQPDGNKYDVTGY